MSTVAGEGMSTMILQVIHTIRPILDHLKKLPVPVTLDLELASCVSALHEGLARLEYIAIQNPSELLRKGVSGMQGSSSSATSPSPNPKTSDISGCIIDTTSNEDCCLNEPSASSASTLGQEQQPQQQFKKLYNHEFTGGSGGQRHSNMMFNPSVGAGTSVSSEKSAFREFFEPRDEQGSVFDPGDLTESVAGCLSFLADSREIELVVNSDPIGSAGDFSPAPVIYWLFGDAGAYRSFLQEIIYTLVKGSAHQSRIEISLTMMPILSADSRKKWRHDKTPMRLSWSFAYEKHPHDTASGSLLNIGPQILNMRGIHETKDRGFDTIDMISFEVLSFQLNMQFPPTSGLLAFCHSARALFDSEDEGGFFKELATTKVAIVSQQGQYQFSGNIMQYLDGWGAQVNHLTLVNNSSLEVQLASFLRDLDSTLKRDPTNGQPVNGKHYTFQNNSPMLSNTKSSINKATPNNTNVNATRPPPRDLIIVDDDLGVFLAVLQHRVLHHTCTTSSILMFTSPTCFIETIAFVQHAVASLGSSNLPRIQIHNGTPWLRPFGAIDYLFETDPALIGVTRSLDPQVRNTHKEGKHWVVGYPGEAGLKYTKTCSPLVQEVNQSDHLTSGEAGLKPTKTSPLVQEVKPSDRVIPEISISTEGSNVSRCGPETGAKSDEPTEVHQPVPISGSDHVRAASSSGLTRSISKLDLPARPSTSPATVSALRTDRLVQIFNHHFGGPYNKCMKNVIGYGSPKVDTCTRPPSLLSGTKKDVAKPETSGLRMTSAKDVVEDVYPLPCIKVLLVEDNAISRLLLSRFLTMRKIQHEVVNDGAEAVASFQQQTKPADQFHIIFMDISMPILSGVEATKQIRQIERDRKWPQSVIVALTASSRVEDRVNMMEAGASDYLVKPASFSLLIKKIIEWGSIQQLIRSGWSSGRSVESTQRDDDPQAIA
ncbi:ssk1 response regulator receiver [Blyttiomyces sp. JEL0837]|nr:ssk1 response regulator receiver [Blyttiomyces sp. JEL0837]